MKQAKRLFLAVLCLALVLTITLLFVVACGEGGYSVTVLSYNKEQGTVTVSEPAKGKLYDADERVMVFVTPTENYRVKIFNINGVAQELDSDGRYTFEITQDTTIEVTFEKNLIDETYTLSFSLGDHAADGAEVPPSVELAVNETTILPEAPEAAEGWKFAGWGEEKLSAGATYTMSAGEKTLTAQWTELAEQYTITSQAGANGRLAFDPEGPYDAGTNVTVFVTPDEGYEVDTFTVNGEDRPLSATNMYTFEIDENTTVSATFRPQSFTVFCRIDEGKGTISLDPQKERYDLNDNVIVTVQPSPGYEFDSLTVNGAAATPEQNSVEIHVIQNITIVARFKATETSATSIPQQYRGEWTQINPLNDNVGKVTITETEFKYDNDIVGEKTFPVFQTVEGYFYMDGKFKTYFGMLGEDVFYIDMSLSLRYLFTGDGQPLDNDFPEMLLNTKWQSSNMGRIEISSQGKATLDGTKLYLLHTETIEGTVRFHILYNGMYWILTYSEGANTIEFGQPGGQGQDTTYNKVEESFLDETYRGNWSLAGGDKTVTVDQDGRFSYNGESCVLTAPKREEYYSYEFTFNNKNYGLGLISGYQMLFVLNFTDNVYELYLQEGAELPNENVALPSSFNGDWFYTDSEGDVHTLHIGDGKMTIDGEQICYFGQEISDGAYIARAIYKNVYWDLAISMDGIEFGNIMYDDNPDEKWFFIFTRDGNSQGSIIAQMPSAILLQLAVTCFEQKQFNRAGICIVEGTCLDLVELRNSFSKRL